MVHPSVGMASLRERVKAGALPKARRPFAIFFVDFIEKGTASGNDPGMQAAAAAWKELGEQGQQSWKELSQKEFVQQQRAATSLGIVYGNSAAVRAERKKRADTVRNSPAKCRRGSSRCLSKAKILRRLALRLQPLQLLATLQPRLVLALCQSRQPWNVMTVHSWGPSGFCLPGPLAVVAMA